MEQCEARVDCGNMRALLILILITIIAEAKKKHLDKTHRKKQENANYVPVPFGHIFKEGFDPYAPVDMLELSSSYHKKDSEVAKQLLAKGSKSILRIKKPASLNSPKDAYLSKEDIEEIEDDLEEKKDDKILQEPLEGNEPYLEEEQAPAPKKEVKKDITWQHLAKLQQDNAGRGSSRLPARVPGRYHSRPRTKQTLRQFADQSESRGEYFLRSSYDLERKMTEDTTYNWTTCQEFGRNANFHPNDVVNIDWVPFYAWSTKDLTKPFAFVHRFSFPTVSLVKTFKDNLGPYANKKLNWEAPKLYMASDGKMLLLATDRRGEFDAIPYNEIPSSMKNSKITIPVINLRLKIVKPFLAMMFCDFHYATIMAVSGSLPNTVRGLRAKADTLKFRGRGYPVARDIQSELLVAKRERQRQLDEQRHKFIEADEQSYMGFI